MEGFSEGQIDDHHLDVEDIRNDDRKGWPGSKVFSKSGAGGGSDLEVR